VPEQRVVLEHEPDAALDPQQRRLARAGGAEQRHEIAARDAETHVVEHGERAEVLADAADFNLHNVHSER
jgi:hypothetical protein